MEDMLILVRRDIICMIYSSVYSLHHSRVISSDTHHCCSSSAHFLTLSSTFILCTSPSYHNTSQQREDLISGINSFYLIFAGALVFFMQLGFAMLCAGSIREKNVKNVLLWNLLDSAGGAFGFWSLGYAFAYGGDDPTSSQKTFIGNAGFFLTGDTDMEFWFFQFAFACALSSIVAGTIAERCQMMVSIICYDYFSMILRILILDPLSSCCSLLI